MAKPTRVCVEFEHGGKIWFDIPLCLIAQEFLLNLAKTEADHPIKEKK